jgi:hypothetical protein
MTTGQWTPFTITLTGRGTIRLKFTPAKRFFLDEVLIVPNNGPETGIDNVNAQPSTLNAQHYFTLDGRMLPGVQTKKGVYIVNGKKVIVK